MTAIIKLLHLTKKFGKKIALDDFNFEIHEGEIFGIVGQSGSGKSTLLKTLIGFLPIEEGDIVFKSTHIFHSSNDADYISIDKNLNETKKVFGYAAQEPSFYEKLSVRENLEHFGTLYDLSRHEKESNLKTLLKLVGLEESIDELAENLSGGMQKRLDLACSLMHAPKILILDEPTSDLDPVLRKQIWDLISEINKRGTTIIMASHFLEHMDLMCSRVAIIEKGKLLRVGTPSELKQDDAELMKISVETVSRNYDKLTEALESDRSITTIKPEFHYLSIYTKNISKTLKNVIKATEDLEDDVIDMNITKQTLNEAFERITGKR